jgi:ribosomal-protein-alanine N-acetyltransferase
LSARRAPRLALETMTRGHLREVLEIERAVFSDPWSLPSFEHEVKGGPVSLCRVARLWPEGGVVGYFVAWRVEDEVHLGNIAVAPAHQGQGIGQELLDDLFTEASAGGGRVLTLEVRESNLAAQRLYLRNGFKPVALRRRYYPDNHEDAIVMMRELETA